jgi:N-methylhydantoinase B/acetone carboxylase, alpha subunit
MQQLRKDNHYVPKLYLKQWAHECQVFTYRLLVPSENTPLWKRQSLKGIAFHQHLYTYLAGQEETDEFERWLDSEFENPAEEAIRRVVREDRMFPEHWRQLVRFAVALNVRTPVRLREFIRRQNETLQELMEETIKRSVRKMEEAIRRNDPLPSSSEEDDALSLFKISIEALPDGGGQLKAETIIGRRLWIWQMRHLLTKTLGRLPAHKWTILHAPTGMSWPTSDNPLIRLNFQNSTNYDFGGGWGVKNGDILLPLSPKHLLYTCIGNQVWPRGTTPDTKTAQLIRKIIIEHADRYVFAQEPIDIRLIRPRLVCPIAYKNELSAWKNWHREQCQAEEELQS